MEPPERVLTLAQYRPRVDRAIEGIFDEAVARAETVDPAYAQLLTVTRDQLLRSGKRLRPYLAYLAFQGTGDGGDILGVAASVELLHHFLLIHDDVMDRDLVRHGGANVAGVYYQQFKDRRLPDGQARHYGDSFALLAGNACCALALQTIGEEDFAPELVVSALGAVHQMLFEVMGGQLTDINLTIPAGPPASLEQLLKVARYKTAGYSFITPLQLGAILAGSSSDTRAQFHKFGKALGVAFQLTDDLLGVYGDEATVGKPILSDMHEGKRTLLIHYALAAATPAQVRRLTAVWGNPAATTADLETVKSLLDDTGARAKVDAQAESYLQEALEAIRQTDLSNEVRSRLVELAHFCVRRTY